MAEHPAELESIILGSMEHYAFLIGETVTPGELPSTVEECLAVSLRFEGSQSGCCTLLCPTALREELAANVLGLSDADDVAVDDADDALKELVNVVTGTVLAHIATPEALFDLSSPELAYDEDGRWWESALEARDSVAMLVEDHPALFRLSLDEAPEDAEAAAC